MITGALLASLFLLLSYGVSILPDSNGLPSGISSGLATILNLAGGWNYWFPITTAFTCISIFLGWEFIIYSWHGIRYVIHFFRGNSA